MARFFAILARFFAKRANLQLTAATPEAGSSVPINQLVATLLVNYEWASREPAKVILADSPPYNSCRALTGVLFDKTRSKDK